MHRRLRRRFLLLRPLLLLRPPQNLPRPLQLHRVLRRQPRRLLPVLRRNNLFVRKAQASSRLRVLRGHPRHKRGHSNPVLRSRKPRNPRPRVRVRNNLFARCPPAIAVRFPEPRREIMNANVAVRVPASRCVRNNPVDKGGVLLHRGPEGPVDRVALAGVSASVPERCPLAHAPGRARPGARECFHLCRTRCPRRPSPENLFMRASRSSGSVPWWTSARWKVSASCTPRASVRELVAAVWLRRRLPRRNPVLPATLR